MVSKHYSVLLEDKFRENFINKSISKFGSQTSLAKYLNSKIKYRKIRREDIKGWLKGKHHCGWDILIPIGVIRELCKINSQDLREVYNNAIKFNPPWMDPKNGGYLLPKTKKIRIISIKTKKYLDIASILPQNTFPSVRSGKCLPLFAKINDNEIFLWSEANWKKSTIKLKRFVELNDLFFIGTSIYASEGTNKVGKYNDSISLGNTEPSLINFFFKWIDSFLKNYKYNIKIDFNGKRFDEKELITFWKKNVSATKNHKIRIIKRVHLGSRLINNMGVLNVKISNTVLKSFIINLVEYSKKISLSNKNYSLAYLEGLLASEGSVSRPKLKEVTIGCIKGKEREFIKNLLKGLDIRFAEGKNQLSISGWSNFLLLHKNKLFSIPQINGISKKEAFSEGFKNHQATKSILRFKRFYNRKFTAREWQEEFDLKSYISAHNYLKRFKDKGLLLSELKSGTMFFYLSKRGKILLKQI